jgi:uncharacterized lipoprotein
MRFKAVAAAAAAALALAGCGGSSNNKQSVRSAFEKVVHELANRNPAACTLFTKRYAIENTGLATYHAALAKCRSHTLHHTLSLPRGLKVVRVKVKGNKANLTASAPGQGIGIFHFVKQGGQWKIDSVATK